MKTFELSKLAANALARGQRHFDMGFLGVYSFKENRSYWRVYSNIPKLAAMFCLAIGLFFTSCKKEAMIEKSPKDLLNGLNSEQLKRINGLGIKWDEVKAIEQDGGKITEFPLERFDRVFTPKSSDLMEKPSQHLLNSQRTALIAIERKDGVVAYNFVYYLPTAENQATKAGIEIMEGTTSFDGTIQLTDLSNKPLAWLQYEDGRLLKPASINTDDSINSRDDECGWLLEEVEVEGWVVIFLFTGGFEFIPFSGTMNVWTYTPCPVVSTIITEFPADSGGGPGGCGAGSFQQLFPDNTMATDVQNIPGLINCMNPDPTGTGTYTVGIYVEQPNPGFPTVFSYGIPPPVADFGQSYLYLKKDDNSGQEVLILGYYPMSTFLGNCNPYLLESNGKLIIPNGAIQEANVGFEKQVSSQEFSQTLNRVLAFATLTPYYNFATRNNTDFPLYAIEPLQISGLGIPPIGMFPNGTTGNCAGVLGQRIALMPMAIGVQVFNGTFIPPTAQGSCF